MVRPWAVSYSTSIGSVIISFTVVEIFGIKAPIGNTLRGRFWEEKGEKFWGKQSIPKKDVRVAETRLLRYHSSKSVQRFDL